MGSVFLEARAKDCMMSGTARGVVERKMKVMYVKLGATYYSMCSTRPTIRYKIYI